MSYKYYEEDLKRLPHNDPDGFGLAIQIRHEANGEHTKWLSLTDECKDALREFITAHPDPDGMTDAQRASQWEKEARRLSVLEENTRKGLAELLINSGFCQICPATWVHITKEIQSLIQSWKLQNGEGS